MAVSSFSDDEALPARGAGGGLPHPLAMAWFLLLAAVLSGILAISIFGKAPANGARFDLTLAPPRPHSARAQAILPQPVNPPPETGDQTVQAPTAGAAPLPAPAAGAMPGAPPPGAVPGATPNVLAGAAPVRLPAKISAPLYAGAALIADPALIEHAPEGNLPRIADDGRRPMTAYAPPVSAAALAGKKKIVLVVTGLGISARGTEAALDGLPPAVTLAFAPYDDDVQRWVAEARRRGHEVLLEVPMEPYDFPDSDPGPHTLRPMLGEDDNIARLKWSLTRFSGYAGVTNLLGGRFLASADAASPVMSFLARRGLLFYDSGTTARSAAESVARDVKAPYVQSGLEIDSIQSGMEIDQRLSELENRARANGAAAGTGFVYPVTVARIAAWARGLEGRGFVLVPASAIVAPNP